MKKSLILATVLLASLNVFAADEQPKTCEKKAACEKAEKKECDSKQQKECCAKEKCAKHKN
jgi:hypothetical protein